MAAARVLIVDDNPFNAKLAGYLLKAEGFEVRSIAVPEEVKAIVDAWSPELILMDLRLPGMDGLTLTRALRADSSSGSIAIIAFSAEGTPEDARRALEAGCNGYIAKPIEVASFGAEVRRFLGSPGPAA